MGDVITRFKLETTQYDSKLRDAAKSMAEFSRQASLAGSEFGKFANKNADAIRALGNIATSATNAKDKVKELVGAYNDLAKEYNALTKEQQQSDFGKAMAQSLTTLQGRIREAKQEVQELGQAVKQVGSGGGLNKLIGGIAGQFGMSASMFTGVGAAVAGFSALKKVVGDNIETAMNFEKSMSGLSALTGMTGKDLDKLKEYAIELGSKTTLTASQVADAFRLIGSQQPQLLESGEALKEVTKYAIQLSEAAGIDLATASQTLSTSINQMGGDSSKAARYVNVLAAASQKGAGDISWLGEAITKSATAAKAVGTDYEELVSNLEQLAKAGFDASTAGTALRSIIMNLEKQSNNEFKPSIVGLTTAFDNLGKAQLSIVQYQDIVGKMFASQAMALANAAGEARNMTDAITGTNIAEEQASTNVNNLSGAIKQLESAWEGLNLHINDSNGPLTSFINELTTTVRQVDVLATKIKGVITDVPVIGTVLEAYGKHMAALINPGAFVGKRALDLIVGDPNKNNDSNFNQSKFFNRLQQISPQTSTFDNRNLYKSAAERLQEIEGDSDNATKSIKELQAELKKLKQLRDDAANTGDVKMRDQYNAQIKDINEQIKALRGGNTTHTTTNREVELVSGSIAEQTKLVQDLQKAWQNAADDESRKKIKAEIEQAQTVLDVMNGKTALSDITITVNDAEALEQIKNIEGVTLDPKTLTVDAETGEAVEVLNAVEGITIDPKNVTVIADTSEALAKLQDIQGIKIEPIDVEGLKALAAAEKQYADAVKNIPTFEGFKGGVSESMRQTELKVDTNALTTMMQVAIQNGINDMDVDFEHLWKDMATVNIDDSTWQNLQDQINEKLAELHIEPIQIDFKTGNLKTVVKDAKKADDGFKDAMQSVQNLGSALNNLEDPGAKIAGTVGQAIAQIALGFAQATATTGGTSGIFGWIAAITGGLATMTSTISAIHNATGYAQGGKVEGPAGIDAVPAWLTAGEIVLNSAQQQNVAQAIMSGNDGGGESGGGIPYVTGETIVLGMNNHLKRSGQGEIVTTGMLKRMKLI